MVTSLEVMVRPAGLEPAASWFVAKNQRIFIDLAPGTMIANGCPLLRVIYDIRALAERTLPKLSNGAMRGVGTKVGTVSGCAGPVCCRRENLSADRSSVKQAELWRRPGFGCSRGST